MYGRLDSITGKGHPPSVGGCVVRPSEWLGTSVFHCASLKAKARRINVGIIGAEFLRKTGPIEYLFPFFSSSGICLRLFDVFKSFEDKLSRIFGRQRR